MIVRPADTADYPAILALWNAAIRDTLVTFLSEEKTADSLSALIAARRAEGREFFVVQTDAVLGFASYGQFRSGNGYTHSMEHTIILADRAWGKGIGRALMARIEDHARAGGAHVMMAGVSGSNPNGIAFHERIGYRTVARIPEVGRKFGRWHDLVLMQKMF